ncbi:MAG: glucosamine-6-phosphate deaminase, partial [Promicromonosporaceae bacterium]|nr:glucosamine-6-phosphate deaminase [Promicromonosporaceae bacterium]
MKIIVRNTAKEAAATAAAIVCAQLTRKPDSVLGLPTGSTPVALYAALISMYEEGLIDFSEATCFNLDEYMGVAADHPASYRRFMHDRLFARVNAEPARLHIPDGMAADPQAECARYEQAVTNAGGIDLMILGIGLNGHIGFNEPSDTFAMRTHLAVLSEATLRSNKRDFSAGEAVPLRAYTMGVGTIFRAREIMLLA